MRLNRTSVGLKLVSLLAGGPTWMMPQSNQRGIETVHVAPPSMGLVPASIEPAWD